MTTLGRGGSDTTAVALAAALGADVCEIYTDVAGVFTADPRIVPDARKLAVVSFEEMLEMSASGAGVLQLRSRRVRPQPRRPDPLRSELRATAPVPSCVAEDETMERPLDHRRHPLDRRGARHADRRPRPARHRRRGSSARSPRRTSTST